MSNPVATSASSCYRIPTGVVFRRWAAEGEFVVYHSGTGETLRLSEGAVAILDLLERTAPMDAEAISRAVGDMMDDPPTPEALGDAVETLLSVLLRHECIERVACG